VVGFIVTFKIAVFSFFILRWARLPRIATWTHVVAVVSIFFSFPFPLGFLPAAGFDLPLPAFSCFWLGMRVRDVRGQKIKLVEESEESEDALRPGHLPGIVRCVGSVIN
jgi:hypothetical protein